MTHLKNALIIIALSLLSLCGYQGYRVLVALESAITTSEARIERVTTTADRVLLSIGGTSAVLRDTAKVARQTSMEQRVHADNAAREFNRTLSALNTNVNERLLPTVTAAVKANSDAAVQLQTEAVWALRRTQDDIGSAVEQLNATALASQRTIEQANTLLSDPTIPATLKNVEGTTKNIEGITDNVKKATKPASMLLRAFSWVYGKVTAGMTAW